MLAAPGAALERVVRPSCPSPGPELLARLDGLRQRWGRDAEAPRLVHRRQAEVVEHGLRTVPAPPPVSVDAQPDPEPKALACYGLWLPGPERMLLRFAAGRPVSAVTCAFLAWAAERLAAEGVRVLAPIWDNAGWHVSHEVRAWITDHNRQAKRNGGCRLLVCRLPSRSPWLNPIEPRWAHGKRAVVEPERKLTGKELQQRLCHHYRCPLLPPLAQSVA